MKLAQPGIVPLQPLLWGTDASLHSTFSVATFSCLMLSLHLDALY
jgi:hypothetical protein